MLPIKPETFIPQAAGVGFVRQARVLARSRDLEILSLSKDKTKYPDCTSYTTFLPERTCFLQIN